MFERKVVGSKCTVVKKKLTSLLGFLVPPSDSAPRVLLPPCFVHSVTLRGKVRSCEICRALNVEPLALRDRSYVRSAMYSKCSTKDWRNKSCWLNPRESGPEVVQGQSGVAASPTLLGPALM